MDIKKRFESVQKMDKSVTSDFVEDFLNTKEKTSKTKPDNTIPRIYCTGPLFSEGEKLEQEKIAFAIEKGGYRTYVPHRDGLEMGEITKCFPYFSECDGVTSKHINFLTYMIERAIFCVDVYELLMACDVICMNMCGRVPDEGACIENGLAFSSGMPVVLYKKDMRSFIFGRDNPMLTGLILGETQGLTVSNVHELPNAIKRGLEYYKVEGKGYGKKDYLTSCSPIVKNIMKAGKEIRKIRNSVDSELTTVMKNCEKVNEKEGYLKFRKKFFPRFIQKMVKAILKFEKLPLRFKHVDIDKIVDCVLK